MDQLSALDASFLYLETPETPMHVGALQIFVLPRGYKGRFVNDLRKHIERRLPLIPAFRRRPWWMPLNLAAPAWVDAEPDLRKHVVEVRLPKVGHANAGVEELEDEVARRHAMLLDRDRPLWKFHVFEGLSPDGHGHRRVGLYMQLHHAAVDGQAAVALSNALFDLSPHPAPLAVKTSTRQRIYKLSMAEMLRGALGHQAQQVTKILRELPGTMGTLNDAAKLAAARSKAARDVAPLVQAPRMDINGHVGTTRAFTGVSVPLAELKAWGKAHDATINDMVLLLCSGALRSFYAQRGALPRRSMIAAVPVSLRAKGDTRSDNQAGMSVVSLGTDIADPLRRLAHIRAATEAMKAALGSVKSIVSTELPSLGVPWLLEALTLLVSKTGLKDHMPRVANVTISNVPGPQVPLFMAGARMVGNYPTSIVIHGNALNITVQSYAGSLDFGLVADAEAMPELRELAAAIGSAYAELLATSAAGGDADAPGMSRSATAKRTKTQRRVTKATAKRPRKHAMKSIVSARRRGSADGALKRTATG